MRATVQDLVTIGTIIRSYMRQFPKEAWEEKEEYLLKSIRSMSIQLGHGYAITRGQDEFGNLISEMLSVDGAWDEACRVDPKFDENVRRINTGECMQIMETLLKNKNYRLANSNPIKPTIRKLNVDWQTDPYWKHYHSNRLGYGGRRHPEIDANPERYELTYSYYQLGSKNFKVNFKPLPDGFIKVEYSHYRIDGRDKTEIHPKEKAREIYKRLKEKKYNHGEIFIQMYRVKEQYRDTLTAKN